MTPHHSVASRSQRALRREQEPDTKAIGEGVTRRSRRSAKRAKRRRAARGGGQEKEFKGKSRSREYLSARRRKRRGEKAVNEVNKIRDQRGSLQGGAQEDERKGVEKTMMAQRAALRRTSQEEEAKQQEETSRVQRLSVRGEVAQKDKGGVIKEDGTVRSRRTSPRRAGHNGGKNQEEEEYKTEEGTPRARRFKMRGKAHAQEEEDKQEEGNIDPFDICDSNHHDPVEVLTEGISSKRVPKCSPPKLQLNIESHSSWEDVETKLYAIGWGRKVSSGKVLYLTPEYRSKSLKVILRDGTKDIDYFLAGHLRKYCQQQFGWVGPPLGAVDLPSSPEREYPARRTLVADLEKPATLIKSTNAQIMPTENDDLVMSELIANFYSNNPMFRKLSSETTAYQFSWGSQTWVIASTESNSRAITSTRPCSTRQRSLPQTLFENARLFFTSCSLNTDFVNALIEGKKNRVGLLFLKLRGVLVACAACLPTSWGVEIFLVATSPDHRRIGYGRLILALVMKVAEELSFTERSHVTILVSATNKNATFYLKSGFEPTQQFHNLHKMEGRVNQGLLTFQCRLNDETQPTTLLNSALGIVRKAKIFSERIGLRSRDVRRSQTKSKKNQDNKPQKRVASLESAESSNRPSKKVRANLNFCSWKVGDSVFAPWFDGTYYKGTIKRLPDSKSLSYKIQWDDNGDCSDLPVNTALLRENPDDERRTKRRTLEDYTAKEVSEVIASKCLQFNSLSRTLISADYHGALIKQEMERGDSHFLCLLEDAGMQDIFCQKSVMLELKKLL